MSNQLSDKQLRALQAIARRIADLEAENAQLQIKNQQLLALLDGRAMWDADGNVIDTREWQPGDSRVMKMVFAGRATPEPISDEVWYRDE